MNKAYAVVGLQYGSEGKGNIVAKLAQKNKPDVAVHNWGPNSGHTAVIDGAKYVHTMLHLTLVSSPNIKYCLFGAGSIINIESLLSEMDACRDIIEQRGVRFIVHPCAAIVTGSHRELEGERISIGSTMKGTAEAAIERMRRDVDGNANVAINAGTELENLHRYSFIISAAAYHQALAAAECVAIEGCQGFSLSMYHGFYPYTTSRDTSVHQLLADCCIPYGADVEVVGCVRTFPIRVANRTDPDTGEMIGWSGPCYGDQGETTFEAIGQTTEFTTVTKLPRRVFTFSMQQVFEACRMNGVNSIALTFADYLDDYEGLVDNLHRVIGVPVSMLASGPDTNDVATVGYVIGAGPDYEVLEEDDGEID